MSRVDLPPSVERLLRELDEEQLRFLNRAVVERLRMLSRDRQSQAMKRFSLMERICVPHDGQMLVGVITRFNRKTVTICTEDGHHWNVSPSLLQKLIDVEGASGIRALL